MGWTRSDRFQSHMLNPQTNNLAYRFSVRPQRISLRTWHCIASVIYRHESLTALIFNPYSNEPYQRLAVASELTIDKLRSRAIIVREDKMTEVIEVERNEPFDRSLEWPFRLVLGVQNGALKSVAVIADHSAVDGLGADILCRQIMSALASGISPETIRSDFHPVYSLLSHQRSIKGTRKSQAALKSWETAFRRVADTSSSSSQNFRAILDPSYDNPIDCIELRSNALSKQILSVARKYGVPPSTVYLLASAKAVLSLLGHDLMVLHNTVTNRLLPGATSSASMMYMRAPAVVSMEHTTTTKDSLQHVANQQLANHMTALTDPWEVDNRVHSRALSNVPPELYTTSFNFSSFISFEAADFMERRTDRDFQSDFEVVRSEVSPGGRPVKIVVWHSEVACLVRLEVRQDSILSDHLEHFPDEFARALVSSGLSM